jgi:hypothetical protein
MEICPTHFLLATLTTIRESMANDWHYKPFKVIWQTYSEGEIDNLYSECIQEKKKKSQSMQSILANQFNQLRA